MCVCAIEELLRRMRVQCCPEKPKASCLFSLLEAQQVRYAYLQIYIYIYDNLNTHKNLAVLVTLIDQDLRCLQVLAWDIFCGIQQVSSHLARSDEAWSDEKMQGLSTSSTAMGPPKLLHVDLSGLKPHLLTYYYTGRGPCCRVVQYCLDTVSLLFALQLWTIFPKNVMAWHHTGRWVHDVPSNLG